MVAPQITALPTPPARNDPANFAARGDAFLLALPLFQTEANAVSEFVDFRIQQAFDAGLEDAAGNAVAAAGSASAASSSASSAASSAASAATLYDQFDDRYLGPKASNPTVDNDGNALLVGAMYFNTAALETRVWNGTTWQSAATVGGTVNSLTVTGALQYQGTLTGGTGVINIGSGQLVKDTAGNLGLGGTPSAWGALYKALDINTHGSIDARNLWMEVSYNNYQNGTNNIYKNSGEASLLRLEGGAFKFFNAPSGAAGNSITFNQPMTLTNGGNLLLGTTTDAGGKLSVSVGNATAIARFTGSVIGSTNVDFYNDQGGSSASNIGLRFYIGAVNTSSIVSRNNAGPAPTLEFFNNGSERARISSGGFLKSSNTGSYIGNNATDFSTSSQHVFLSNSATAVLVASSTSTAVGAYCFVADLPTAAAGQLFRGTSNNTTVVYQVLANGNVQNTNNSYGAISDPKLKDIIGPKSSTWEKTKQYNWIEYYLKSDSDHSFKMLGLNAEEAAVISPGVVDESPDLVEVTKFRKIPVQIVRLDENENPVVDEETGEVIYDEVMVNEPYTEWEPNGEFTKSVKYSVVSMQYHRTTQECQERIEDLETAKVQTDDLIQQIMGRVAALESASS